MSRRLLTTGLIVAALLAGRVTAKPPDLPLPQNDVLAPLTRPAAAAATPYVFPQAAEPATEAPLFFRVRPSVRRTMASCLLFAAHPLLALSPTEDYVDFDEDDVQPGTIQALFVSPVVEEPSAEGRLVGTGVNNNAGLTGSFSDDSTPSVCPWMRQLQQCDADRHGVVFADIDLSNDVLHNLEMLREAQTLMQTARELGSAGHVCEAMDCLQLAHDLCPGGWLDHRIEEATAEVFVSVYCDSPQEDAAAAPSCKKNAKEWEIEHKLAQPVSLHFDDAPLYQVIDDLRCWQGLNIYVDKAALDADEVSLDQPVTIKLENVSLKSALRLTLRSVHLDYFLKDGVLQITTELAVPANRQHIEYGGSDLVIPAQGGDPSVDYLMQQCHAAMDAGQTHKAAELARQAFAVDPEAAAADPLVYKMQLIGDATAPPSDSLSLRPCLPPVDPGTPAALDQLYPEISRPLLAVSGGEEQVAPADVLKGVAKPFLKTGDLEEVGCGKNGGTPPVDHSAE